MTNEASKKCVRRYHILPGYMRKEAARQVCKLVFFCSHRRCRHCCQYSCSKRSSSKHESVLHTLSAYNPPYSTFAPQCTNYRLGDTKPGWIQILGLNTLHEFFFHTTQNHTWKPFGWLASLGLLFPIAGGRGSQEPHRRVF